MAHHETSAHPVKRMEEEFVIRFHRFGDHSQWQFIFQKKRERKEEDLMERRG